MNERYEVALANIVEFVGVVLVRFAILLSIRVFACAVVFRDPHRIIDIGSDDFLHDVGVSLQEGCTHDQFRSRELPARPETPFIEEYV